MGRPYILVIFNAFTWLFKSLHRLDLSCWGQRNSFTCYLSAVIADMTQNFGYKNMTVIYASLMPRISYSPLDFGQSCHYLCRRIPLSLYVPFWFMVRFLPILPLYLWRSPFLPYISPFHLYILLYIFLLIHQFLLLPFFWMGQSCRE